jgi:hypothetical protein
LCGASAESAKHIAALQSALEGERNAALKQVSDALNEEFSRKFVPARLGVTYSDLTIPHSTRRAAHMNEEIKRQVAAEVVHPPCGAC